MEITILGSGGNTPIPMPTCDCRICVEAREKGVPYSRAGNSTFIHDENILIDTPERVWDSLNRERIEEVDYIFISHFHYDHILGLRVVQALGIADHPIDEWFGDLPTLVMSQATYDKINGEEGLLSHLIEQWTDLEILNDGEEMKIEDINVKSIGAEIVPGEGKEIFSFIFEKEDKKVLVSPDENKFLDLSRIPELELWIRETGKFSYDAEGNRIMTEEKEEEDGELEITFEETLDQIREVRPERTVLTEIEELFRYSYEDLKEVEEEHQDLDLEFAYDGMNLEV
jgi:phosphoribosyl 1,2-cyclic phosphate phosphodiesterase